MTRPRKAGSGETGPRDRPKPRIDLPRDGIAAFCRRWQVTEFALFGSVLRDDFGPNSDVDVLVRFDPKARPSLLDLVDMQEELSGMFGRKVDLVTRDAVEESRNHLRRRDILESAQVVHEA